MKKPSIYESAIIWYARKFPIRKGKLRLVDLAWRLCMYKNKTREAILIYSDLKMPCNLQEMLQRQFFFFGTYHLEEHILHAWRSESKKASVIFDVGANSGIYGFVSLSANPEATVHAFEPTSEIADRVRMVTQTNSIDGLFVHQCAVSDSTGTAKLIRCNGGGDNDGMNYIDKEASNIGETVTLISIDEFMARNRIEHIDLLKIDVQGHEIEVLRGCSRALAEGQIDTIFLELNWGESSYAQNCVASQCLSVLELNGFLFASTSTPDMLRRSGKWLNNESDVIARRQLAQ